MSAVDLFESFCWGVTGGSVVLLTQNGVKLRGYRKARKDDHRGADHDSGATTLHIPGASAEGASEGVAPDQIEPIIAWRGWEVEPQGFLASTSQEGSRWPARKAFEADCKMKMYDDKPHEAPAKKCSCGIYAGKQELDLQTGSGIVAWGRVALWGRIEEGEKGYRAQYAYPVSLTLVGGTKIWRHSAHTWTPTPVELENLRDQLALHYGVPVRIGDPSELEAARVENYKSMGVPPEVQELVG